MVKPLNVIGEREASENEIMTATERAAKGGRRTRGSDVANQLARSGQTSLRSLPSGVLNEEEENMMKFRHQVRHVLPVVTLVCGVLANPAPAQFGQQGPKLVGTGAAGAARQGSSVSLSGDWNTAILGGPGDNPSPPLNRDPARPKRIQGDAGQDQPEERASDASVHNLLLRL